MQETAIEMRTRSTIAKLNAIIMQKYESYRTRRLPIRTFTDENGVDLNGNGNPNDTYTPFAVAKYRLDALRNIMRMEMPESFQDVQDDPITVQVIGAAPSSTTIIQRPSINQSYKNVLDAAKARNSSIYGSTNLQQAMCLYLLVSKGCDDPDIMEQFAPNEIKTDPDLGLSYFVDGWGNPIYFLRWAPGFVAPFSALQPDPAATSGPKPAHDQFDPTNVYAAANHVALYPLIYSPGPDGKYEVEVANGLQYSAHNNDPYYSADTPPTVGDWKDDGDKTDGRIDNITNHYIETR